MLRIDWAIPCRYAETNGALITIVGGVIDTFYVRGYPSVVGMMLATRILGLPADLAGEHVMRMELADDEMNTIHGAELRFTHDSESDDATAPAGWERAFYFVGAHQFQVERDGQYTLTLVLDGSTDNRMRRSIPLRVVTAPDAGA
jgi:hypothetical protein